MKSSIVIIEDVKVLQNLIGYSLKPLNCELHFADLKVIYLTSLYSREDTGPLGKSIGGDLFLSKQVNDKNLMECIDNLVAKK